jgi:hypothetical protein
MVFLPKNGVPPLFVAASWRFVELLASLRQIDGNLVHRRVIKSKKSDPQPFPKAARLDTYPPHPTGFAPGLPSKEVFGTDQASHANSVGP